MFTKVNQGEKTMNFFENQWVEVFKVGEHTDSAGKKQEWTAGDLAEIVRNYNAKKHEAPVVIGHPKDNAPAFGWVEALKTDGKTLFAKFKQLVPEFVEAVKKGMYKKRSISLYPDFTLRHIGFLGAVPPAVKGLADIAFSESGSITIETDLGSGGVAQDCHVASTRLVPQPQVGSVNNPAPMNQYEEKKGEKSMNVKNLDPASSAGNQTKEQEITGLKKQLEDEQRKNRAAEFKSFVERLHREGRVVSDLQNDIVELMEALHRVGEFNFSEGRANALERFRRYLAKQPRLVQFGEAVKEDIVKQSSAFEQLNLLTMERAKKDNISFSQALSAVQKEYPDLAQAAAMEI